MGYMYLSGQPGLGAEFVLKAGGAGEFPAESRPGSKTDAEVDRTNHFNSIYHMWRVDPTTGFYSAADDRLRKKVRSWQRALGLRRDGIISLDLAKTLRVLAENWATYESSLRGLGEEIARTLKFPAQSDKRADFYKVYKAETARTLGALVEVWVNFWLPDPLYSGDDYQIFGVCYDSKAPAPRVGSTSCSGGEKDHNVTDFGPREGVRGATADWIDRLRSVLNVPAYWQSSKPEWRAFRRGLGVDELPHGSTYVIPAPGAAAAMRVYDRFRARGEELWERHRPRATSNIPLAACPQVKADAEFVVKQIQDNRELSAGQKALLVSETGLSKLLTCGEYAASDVVKHAAKLTEALVKGERTVCSQGVGATYGPLFKLVNPADGGWGTAAQAAAVLGFQRVAEGVCSGAIKPGEPAPASTARPGLDFSQVQWILPGRRGEGRIPSRLFIPKGGGGGRDTQASQASQAEIADLRAQLQALQAQAQAQQQNQGAVAPDVAQELAQVEQELEDRGVAPLPPPAPPPAPSSKMPLLIGGAVAAYLLFKS